MKGIVFCIAATAAVLASVYWLGTRTDRQKHAIDQVVAARAEERRIALKLDLEKLYGHPCMIGVSLQAYSLLKLDMAEVDARNIIGGEGIEQSSAGNVVTKCWRDKGKAIVLTFQDGRIVAKSQLGL